jgi:ATP-binding cassette subfamily F protein 3
MDKLVTHTVGIHRKKARKIPGNTEKYYDRIAQDEEIYEKTRLNDERQAKRRSACSSPASGPRPGWPTWSSPASRPWPKWKKGQAGANQDTWSSLSAASPSRPSRCLPWKTFPLPGEPTGRCSKTWLFHSGRGADLRRGQKRQGQDHPAQGAGRHPPPASGNITYNPQVESGVFEQTNIQSLVDSRTVEEEILYAQPDVDRQKARNICGAMMFEGDNALKKISVLSGGEKAG